MRLASGRYRVADNSRLTKHVVAAGRSVRDRGSTPLASTISLSPSGAGLRTQAPRKPLDLNVKIEDFIRNRKLVGQRKDAKVRRVLSGRTQKQLSAIHHHLVPVRDSRCPDVTDRTAGSVASPSVQRACHRSTEISPVIFGNHFAST